MKKRILSLALALMMCLGFAPAPMAWAVEGDVMAAAREAGLLVYFDEGFTPELGETVTFYDITKVLAGVIDLEVDLSQVDDSGRDEAIQEALRAAYHVSYVSRCNRGSVAYNLYGALRYRATRVCESAWDTFLENVDQGKRFPDVSEEDNQEIIRLYNIDVIDGNAEGNFASEDITTWDTLLNWTVAAKKWATTSPDSLENLPILTTPTDLVWGIKHQDGTQETKALPGYMSMKTEGNHQNRFVYTLYRQGETEPVGTESMHYSDSSQMIYFGNEIFLHMTAKGEPPYKYSYMDSGSYYFTVKALGDGINYRDSEESAPSEIFVYERPNSELLPPKTLSWNGREIKWIAGADSSEKTVYYEIVYYYAKTEETPLGERKAIGGSTTPNEGSVLSDSKIQANGPGYYWFKVRALSNDITKYQGSDWSELSPAYHLTDTSTKDSLTNILTDVENKTGDEIRQAVQELNTGDLKNSLLADQHEAGGTAELLRQLEEKTGITVDTAATEERFEDMAANAQVVGAALNDVPQGTDNITLNISAPEKEHVIPEQYNNTVALRFGMGLEGVVDQENLKVPVRVTLPIPSNINPSFLVILHYGQDGSVEELGITKTYIFQQEGRWYVSFVLTHFSDFVLTEAKQAEPDPEPTPTPTPPPSSGGSSGGGGGGGSSVSSYAITLPKVSHGKVSVSPKSAQRGDRVTLTVIPDKGYVLDNLEVLDSKGKKVDLADVGEGKYTFTMPGSKVEVKAAFVEEKPAETPPAVETPTVVPVTERFTDIAPGDWYVSAVQYACDKGLMEGMSETAFVPSGPLTRGALVTILHRLEGLPASVGHSFKDVPAGQWYTAGVVWASANGLVNGFEDGTFRPEAPVTREQLAAILYRYAGRKGRNTAVRADLTAFLDKGQVSAYAGEPVAWAVSEGLLNGTDWGGLDPQKEATRARIAAILQRFLERIEEK